MLVICCRSLNNLEPVNSSLVTTSSMASMVVKLELTQSYTIVLTNPAAASTPSIVNLAYTVWPAGAAGGPFMVAVSSDLASVNSLHA